MNVRQTTHSRQHGPIQAAGFTLIEILVVVSIIAILTGMIGGNFITSRIRARDAERKSSLTQIQRSLEIYYNDHGTYPDATGNRIADGDWGGPFTDDDGTIYMAQMPSDPDAPLSQYLYEVDATLSKYRLYARLENERDIDTDLDRNGLPGDVYDGSVGDNSSKYCGTDYCNYGLASPSTTMEETW